MATRPVVTIERSLFQALHNAARGMYSQLLSVETMVSPEFAEYMETLNRAITVGHQLLGTERLSADNYIGLMKQVHEAQLAQVSEFIEANKRYLEEDDLEL